MMIYHKENPSPSLDDGIVSTLVDVLQRAKWLLPQRKKITVPGCTTAVSNYDYDGVSHNILNYLIPDTKHKTECAQHGVDQMHRAGKCIITVYDPESSTFDILFQREYAKSPFVLGPCSKAYLQMLTQAATTFYMNRDMKYIYTCVICLTDSDGGVYPACQISFDVGFTEKLIQDYITRSMQLFPSPEWKAEYNLVKPIPIKVSVD
jgi:hypothetical protein